MISKPVASKGAVISVVKLQQLDKFGASSSIP